MNDIVTAFALIGAYSLGILTMLGVISYIIKKYDSRKQNVSDDMDQAIRNVQEAMPGSTVLHTETNV